MEIILIRHTPVEVRPGTCYGHLDVPLAANCVADIAATLAPLATVDVVFSSPTQRCLELAKSLSARDAAALNLAHELRELNFGAWEGLSWSEIPRAQSDPWAEDPWNRAPPGGETEQQLWQRVDTWRRIALDRAVGRIAVVAHAGSLRALRALLLGLTHERSWQWRIDCGAAEMLVGAS
jgi:alpha-ribazole phosphatase